MGGWMTYGRLRDRNNLKRKPDDDPDPYWRDQSKHSYAAGNPERALIAGELNRMERGYLAPEVDDGRGCGERLESNPLYETAEKTGVDVETVRKVLRFVFLEQR